MSRCSSPRPCLEYRNEPSSLGRVDLVQCALIFLYASICPPLLSVSPLHLFLLHLYSVLPSQPACSAPSYLSRVPPQRKVTIMTPPRLCSMRCRVCYTYVRVRYASRCDIGPRGMRSCLLLVLLVPTSSLALHSLILLSLPRTHTLFGIAPTVTAPLHSTAFTGR